MMSHSKQKRYLCAATVIAVLASAFGCSPVQEGDSSAPAKQSWLQIVNSYEEDKTMRIGAHGEPEPTLEAYRTAAEMGLNFTFLVENKDNPSVYDLAEQVGMKVIPSMGNTLSSFKGMDWSDDWSQYSSVFAVDYFDEPRAAQFDIISEWVDIHNEKYAATNGEKPLFWVNMLPLDAAEHIRPQTDEEFLAEYCEKVLSKVNGNAILSYDYYPLQSSWLDGKFRFNYLAEGWLRTLELNAKYAKQYGFDTHAYLQTCGFYQPSETGYSWTCHMSDEDDLRFQAYVSMAFGIRNFTHFTYKTSELYGQGLGYTQACVNKDGTINDLYYDAQAINRELLSLDHVYLSYDYVGTKCFVGTENESGKNTAFDRLEYGLRELEGISSVTCTQDTVIGALKDETGRRGFVVVNYTEPTAEKSDTVEITVPESVHSYAVYSKGEWKEIKAEQGKISISLLPGQGVFAIEIEE